jgi:hypothetical protein
VSETSQRERLRGRSPDHTSAEIDARSKRPLIEERPYALPERFGVGPAPAGAPPGECVGRPNGNGNTPIHFPRAGDPAAANHRVAYLRIMLGGAMEERSRWVKRSAAAGVKSLTCVKEGFHSWEVEEYGSSRSGTRSARQPVSRGRSLCTRECGARTPSCSGRRPARLGGVGLIDPRPFQR